jgi:hypothetical protein
MRIASQSKRPGGDSFPGNRQADTGRRRAEKTDPRSGAGNRIRTYDPRITNALLYQLSYPGVATAASRAFYIFLRSLITRSMPATSVPGGGAGRRLNSTAGTGTSISAPLDSSWKW